MESLTKLGFTKKELNFYKILLRIGPSTILQLSRVSSKPRSTVHHTIENLKKKGLVFETVKNGRRKIVAEHPQKIELLIDREEQKISKRNDTLNQLRIETKKFILNQSQLKDLTNETEVRYIEGIEPIQLLYDEILLSKEVKSYANLDLILNYFPENGLKFINAMEKGIEIWDMFMSDNLVQEEINEFLRHENYHIKLFPKDFDFEPMDYLIWNDSIAVVNSGGIPNAVITTNKTLAKNTRSLYDLLWSFLPEINE